MLGQWLVCMTIETITRNCHFELICFSPDELNNSQITDSILLTKTTAAQNEVALSYQRVRGLYFVAVVFVRSVIYTSHKHKHDKPP